MKVMVVSILFLMFLISCSTNDIKKTNENEMLSMIDKQGILLNNTYSFKYDTKNSKSRVPVISIIIDDKLVTFECDTGAATSFIHKSGMKKIVKNFDEWQNASIELFLDYLNNNDSNNYTFNEARRIYLNMTKKGISYIKYPIVFEQDNEKYIVNLNYSNMKSNCDGVLGLDFFLQLKNLIIDYKTNKFIINSDIIIDDGIPLLLCDEPIGKSLYIDCIINDEIERCLLDTGLNCCIIRQDFQNSQTINNELFSTEKKGTITNNIQKLKIASLEYNNIIFYYAVSTNFLCSDKVREYYKKHTGLGFSVFKDHILKFDFKNMLFCVEE